jgi:hypothetical protein
MSPTACCITVLVCSLCACEGEHGSGKFSLDDNADRIAVGTSTAVQIHNDNYYSHGLGRDHHVLQEDPTPITNLQVETVPSGVVSTRVEGDRVIVTGLRAGKVTVIVRGEIRGVQQEHSVEIETVLPASTYYEIAGYVVKPGEEITLLRGVQYEASVRVYDANGERLNAKLRPANVMDFPGTDTSWTSSGDIPVAGPGWIWSSRDATGTVQDPRAESISLPAVAGTLAPRARFIDDVTLDLEWNADHHRVSLIATSRDGTWRQRVLIDLVARQPEGCEVLSDLTGVYAAAHGGPCNAELTINTDPRNLYTSKWTGPLALEATVFDGPQPSPGPSYPHLDYRPAGTVVRQAR